MRYRYFGLASFVLGIIAVMVMPSQSFAVEFGSPRLPLADYALSANEQIHLQDVAGEFTAAVSPTLKRTLMVIDVRTALEDTERLHNDRG